jgi:Flp pilus assembly protein TadG
MFDAIRNRLNSIRSKLADKRGSVAVEFAFILPVMLLIYIGSAEVSQAVSCYRLVQLTNSTVVNIISQYVTISQSTQLPDIFAASQDVLTPYPSSGAFIVVSGIKINKVTGVATVDWSQTNTGSGGRAVGSVIAVPAAFKTGGYLIYGETTYSYKPGIDFINMGTVPLHSQLYMLPRASSTIAVTP